jgi:type I restriction enzyme M protein
VQPAHHPAPADRHFLRPGRQDQRAVLHARPTDKENTSEVWVYDLRANMPNFGKKTTLNRGHFAAFEACYGDEPTYTPSLPGKGPGDRSETERFKRFTREWIAERGDNLDIAWLKDESETAADDLPEPAALAESALGELEAAMAELRGILAELGDEVDNE